MQLPAPSERGQLKHQQQMKDHKMFASILKKFTAEPVINHELIQANEALKTRVDQMFWSSSITRLYPIEEYKQPELVKKQISIRKKIAA